MKKILLFLLALSTTILYSMEEQTPDENIEEQTSDEQPEKISAPVTLWRLIHNTDTGFPPLFFISSLAYTKESNEDIEKLDTPSEVQDYVIWVKNQLGAKLVKILSTKDLKQEGKKNIQLLINSGANINFQDDYKTTALIYAARFGHEDIVEVLITKKADLDLQDVNGITALLEALFHQKEDIAKLLIEKGANINLETTSRWIPLIIAASEGYENLVKTIIAKGTDINHQNIEGNTALIEAAANGHKDLVELLIKEGANLTIKNNQQRTALDIARARGNQPIINLLENAEERQAREKHS